jgi:hypothetical protein
MLAFLTSAARAMAEVASEHLSCKTNITPSLFLHVPITVQLILDTLHLLF